MSGAYRPGRTAPCRDCGERTGACHGTCEKYRAWREQHEKWRAAEALRDIGERYTSQAVQANWRRNLRRQG